MAEKQVRPRILLVDDEPAIRLTLPSILDMSGFEVSSAATVPQALDAINRQQFDVLLADLNIGQPGDGFTVVSAMRRTQPEAVTIIITGYPAFETALEAIRSQVDDYIVKPADIPYLLQVIEQHLNGSRDRPVLLRKPVSRILRDNRDPIVQDWLSSVKKDPELQGITTSDAERTDHIPPLLDEVIDSLEQHPGTLSEPAMSAALEHGQVRRDQGYTVSQLLKESRHLRRVLCSCIQQHLLSVDISTLLTDLINASEILDISVRASVEGFLGEEKRAA
jgi:DNA-binding response OmpR family regulator